MKVLQKLKLIQKKQNYKEIKLILKIIQLILIKI